MTIVSVVLHVRPNFIPHFKANRRRRELRDICKQLARGYESLGVYHSHHTERKGGQFAPHLHLLIEVPDDRLDRFQDGLDDDLRHKDQHGYFQLSPRSSWVLSADKLRLWQYVLGAGRKHTPEIVYGRV